MLGIFIFYNLKERESSQEKLTYISVQDLIKNPLFYLNKTIQTEGTVRLMGEYLTGFFLLEEENSQIQVEPWAPSLVERCPENEDCPSISLMGGYIDKRVSLTGVFREVNFSREIYENLSINGKYYLIEEITNVKILF